MASAGNARAKKQAEPEAAVGPIHRGDEASIRFLAEVRESHLRPGPFDPSGGLDPWPARRNAGKALRAAVPRESHAAWVPPADRPDPVDIVLASNEGRQGHLIPLRMGRMAASPFTFLRGAAAVMAWDLAHTPVTGAQVILDGDAHLNNFGLFGTVQRDVVFDLNDFDEATIGPWEWDIKRLVASVNVAARGNGLSRKERRLAVRKCVEGYRFNAERLQSVGVLNTWYLHAYPDRDTSFVKIDAQSRAIIMRAVEKARRKTNETLLAEVAQRQADGSWRFLEDPPVLTHVDDETKSKVVASLVDYVATLTPERRFMLKHYRVADVAHRVVGVGSVGTRAYLVLLIGNGDTDPLFLQVKEAISPSHAPYTPPLPEQLVHAGQRVVLCQSALQSSTDIMLGWTSIDGRPFYVRQMKNLKGSIPVEWLVGRPFNFYAWACGALLARAHARTGDIAKIAGYCGKSAVLDEALAQFAEAYGDQTERDHAALTAAIRDGRIEAISGI